MALRPCRFAAGIVGVCFVLLFPAVIFAAKVPAEFPQGMVSLNFDDGFETTYDHAVSLLRKYGFKATFYIVTDYYKKQHASMVTGEQALRLQMFDHEVGAHSRKHPLLRKVTNKGLKSEVLGSKKDLEKLGIKSVTTFCYPYGDYKKRVRTAVVNAGYMGARTSDYGYNTPRSDRYLLKVVLVVRKSDFSTVRSRIDWAIEHKLWIILVFHDIQRKPMKYGTTPNMLSAVLRYIRDKHMKVVTNSEGIQMMNDVRKALIPTVVE